MTEIEKLKEEIRRLEAVITMAAGVVEGVSVRYGTQPRSNELMASRNELAALAKGLRQSLHHTAKQ
jgi:hypothetical protein